MSTRSTSVEGTASGSCSRGEIAELAEGLVAQLQQLSFAGKSVVVLTLQNRAGNEVGAILCEELADKLTAALVGTGQFDVQERINLQAILDEKDFREASIESPEILHVEAVRSRVAGADYVILGGVTASASKPLPPDPVGQRARATLHLVDGRSITGRVTRNGDFYEVHTSVGVIRVPVKNVVYIEELSD